MNKEREAEWAEAQRRCRLSDEAVQMARELGMNPRKLIKNRPTPNQRWKAPVEDWVREIYRNQFGDRRPSRTSAVEPGTGGQEDELEGFPEGNLLAEAEAEFDRRFREGEIDEDMISAEYERMERETPVSKGEIEAQNRLMLKRRDSYRLAAELVAVQLSQVPFVEKVVLFGSVAAPLKKEVPRFRRLRRAAAAIYHECHDVDLAVWVSNLTDLRRLKKAVSAGTNQHQAQTVESALPGVPADQVDVHLFEAGTNRYRGNLCGYSTCPKGKPPCEVAGCGAQPFLRLFEDFKFDRFCLFDEHNVVLFERPKPAAPAPSSDQPANKDLPF